MTEIKKYAKTINFLLIMVIAGILFINLFLFKHINILSFIINILAIIVVLSMIYSTIITYFILNDNKINKNLISINYKIIKFIYPVISNLGKFIGVPKDEIRKIFVKVNNTCIYNREYNLKNEDLVILIPHCIQNHNCKLKVTNDISNCKKCGMCKISSLLEIKETYNINMFVATGGTIARKIIVDNKPKAVIAVACERDLTSGIKDVSGIPVLGVFNDRPNGPCIDTNIDTKKIEEAIKFFTSK